MQPRFSVITITKDDCEGFKRTLNSVQEQTCRDFEWIVVDGGSTDGTLDLIHENSKDITWYCSGKDTGLFNAMNIGTDQAKGDYIVYMNGGDKFANKDVLNLVDKIAKEKNNPDYLYGDAFLKTNNGALVYQKAMGQLNLWQSMPARHQSIYYYRETLGNIRYNEKYKIAADYELTAGFAKESSNIVYIKEPLCTYDINGVSGKKHLTRFKENFQIYSDVLEHDIVSSFVTATKKICGTAMRSFAPKFHTALKNTLYGL